MDKHFPTVLSIRTSLGINGHDNTLAAKHFSGFPHKVWPAHGGSYLPQPGVYGRGSAIFLHVSTGRATNGCVSLPEARLIRLLRWLRPSAAPVLHLGIS